MRYCSSCVYPEIAVNLLFDDDGVCSGCTVAEEYEKLTPEFWSNREVNFRTLLEDYRSKDERS